MGLAKQLWRSIKPTDITEDEDEFEPDAEFDDLDYSDEEPEAPKSGKKTAGYGRRRNNINNNINNNDDMLDIDEEDDYQEEPEPERRSIFRSRKSQPEVVSMKNKGSMEVWMIKPETINDAKDIIDVLLGGKAVVINMEGLNYDIAQRIADCAFGAGYAMDGNFKSISKSILIITPNNIGLSGDFLSNGNANDDDLSINM